MPVTGWHANKNTGVLVKGQQERCKTIFAVKSLSKEICLLISLHSKGMLLVRRRGSMYMLRYVSVFVGQNTFPFIYSEGTRMQGLFVRKKWYHF